MYKRVYILQNDLAKIIGVSQNVLHTYLGHFTLFKYVKHRYKYTENSRSRQTCFYVTPESIYALQEYLKIKLRYGKAKNRIKLSGIEKLKKLYEEATSNDVAKNEN